MARSFDTGPLPVDAHEAAMLLAWVFDVPSVKVTDPFEVLPMTVYTVTVQGIDSTRMSFRIRTEGGKTRVQVQVYNHHHR